MFTPETSLKRSLRPSRRVSSPRCGHAFTLVEILVVIAILALLALIAMPAISRMVVSGQIAKSTSNLKQIQNGIALYVAENNGNYPLAQMGADGPNSTWYEGVGRLLYPEIRQRLPSGVPWMFSDSRNPNGYKGTAFWSPAAEPGANIRVATYGFNQMLSVGNFRKYSLRFRGATTGLVADNNLIKPGGRATHSLMQDSRYEYRINPRYGASAPHAGDGKATVLYLDGHVEVLDAETCKKINEDRAHKFWGDKL